MIYSNEFVWLHFPKCAGTKIEQIFAKYYADEKGIIQDKTGLKNDNSIKWHDTLEKREKRDSSFKLGSRTVIFPIRRLPSWLESRYNFEIGRSPDLPRKPNQLLKGRYLNKKGKIRNANNFLETFLPEYLLQANQVEFIRVEHFESDFKKVFSQYIDISKIPDQNFSEKINISEQYIPKSIRKKLYHRKSGLYELCPYWETVENIAYKNDEQAGILYDKAIAALKNSELESALDYLSVAYKIKPHNSRIRLQLIDVLVKLNRFEKVIPHIDFLNNPPENIKTKPQLKKLLKKLHSVLPIVMKDFLQK